MQITDSFHNGAVPPSQGGNAPSLETAQQIRRYRARQRLTLLLRSIRFWWYRILIILLAGLFAGVFGQFIFQLPKEFLGGAVALVLFFWAIRRLEFGLILAALLATAFSPKAFTLKSIDIYPIEPLLALLFFAILVQAAFHVRKFVWPSFWTIWPQLGLILMAVISVIVIQFTWIPQVPRKLNSSPVIYSDLLGIGMYCFPLLTITVTTACLSNKERLVEYVQNAFLVMAAAAAVVIGFEFRRVGGDIYTFRYSEPVIIYMSLRALAQLLGLGAMISYARFFHATRWLMRILYAVMTIACVLSVYFTLENSWWLEVGVGLLVITLVYSRKLFLLFAALSIPLLPFVKAEITKLQTVKSADSYRIVIWQDVLRVWSKRPVLGVGPGNLWSYDQIYTHLPVLLRNFDTTGLGVAHDGVLQILAELGPLGLLFFFSFIGVVLVTAGRLCRRSNTPETRNDRILGLVCIGLICGSFAGDLFSGSFFLPPRQIGSFNDLPQVLTSWIMFGCLFYKDQLWRMAQRRVKYPGLSVTGSNQ